ncbi:MAG: cellulase family glycosylhydrolase [Tepidisphaeraceae bacterium]
MARGALLAMTLLACVRAAAEPPAPAALPAILQPPTVRDAIAINIHFTAPRPGEMKLLADLGVGRVRMDVGWHRVETEAGRYDFSAYDALLRDLDAAHVKAMLILDYGNTLYTGSPKAAPTTPPARAAFARFAAATVAHFKGRGVLWEIYNEPNNKEYWQPTPDPALYAQLARETAATIRAVAPDEVLCGPALAAVDLPYLEKAVDAGLLDSIDAVTVHPYRQTAPETLGRDLDAIEQVLVARRPAGKTVPVIAGEWGYPMVWVDATTRVNFAARQMLYGLSRRLPLNVWYDWRRGGSYEGKLDIFGLLDARPAPNGEISLETTPVYDALAALCRTLGPTHFTERLKLTADNRADDYLLAFDGPAGRRYAMWTARPDAGGPVIVALPDGAYYLLDVWGHRAGTVKSKGGFKYRVSGSPVYVVPATAPAGPPEL